MKKYFFKSLSLIAVSGPMVLAVSCTTTANDNSNKAAIKALSEVKSGNSMKGTKLRLGIRKGEANIWGPVIDAFMKGTGATVELVDVGGMKEDYSSWKKDGGVPDITVTDQGVVSNNSAGDKGEWLQEFDLKDLLTNSEYQVSTLNETKTKPEDFTLAAIQGYGGRKDKTKMTSLPLFIGPSALVYNKKMLKSDQTIKTYLPVTTKEHPFKVRSISPATEGKAFEATKLGKSSPAKCTVDNMQKYLNGSALESNRDNVDVENHWYSIGESGKNQRLFSIAKSCIKFEKDGYVLKGSSDPGWLDMFEGPKTIYGKNKGYFGKDGLMGMDEKVFSLDNNTTDKFPIGTSHLTNGSTMDHPLTLDQLHKNKLLNKIYFSKTAYIGLHNKRNNVQKGLEKMVQGKAAMADMALWQMGSLKAYITKYKKKESDFASIGMPFGSAGFDGMAIKSGISGDKLLAAKKLLRFLAQDYVNAAATGGKTVPVNNRGYEYITYGDDLHKGYQKFGSAAAKPGHLSGMQNIYTGATDHGIQDTWYNMGFRILQRQGHDSNTPISMDEFLYSINASNVNYWKAWKEKTGNNEDAYNKNPLIIASNAS